jgi:hypothetical protein
VADGAHVLRHRDHVRRARRPGRPGLGGRAGRLLRRPASRADPARHGAARRGHSRARADLPRWRACALSPHGRAALQREHLRARRAGLRDTPRSHGRGHRPHDRGVRCRRATLRRGGIRRRRDPRRARLPHHPVPRHRHQPADGHVGRPAREPGEIRPIDPRRRPRRGAGPLPGGRPPLPRGPRAGSGARRIPHGRPLARGGRRGLPPRVELGQLQAPPPPVPTRRSRSRRGSARPSAPRSR